MENVGMQGKAVKMGKAKIQGKAGQMEKVEV